jgi:membrane fusion protein (multidrug efflux system)
VRTALSSLIAASLGAGGCSSSPPPAAAPPPEVYVTPVVQKDVPVYLDLVGQAAGSQDVEIRARVEGFLETVNFREGSFVHKGELLYQIDPKPLEAALLEAKADQARAEATFEKTNNDVVRYTPLAAQQAVSRQELDNAVSARQAARAQVEAAKASVTQATLNLGYTRVYSPINGLVGITEVKPGNLVGKGSPTLLTTVSQIDPIFFNVSMTEADYLRVAKARAERIGQQPKVEGIELTLADGSVHPDKGKVNSIGRAVDPTTGTLGVQLVFPNPQFVLRPGQYGRVRVLLETKPLAMLVPQRAVQELQNLHSVAVVGADKKIEFHNVTVGPRVDADWVIESGVNPGDKIVAEGLQALRDGIEVRTKPMPVATTGSGPAEPARDTK